MHTVLLDMYIHKQYTGRYILAKVRFHHKLRAELYKHGIFQKKY